MQDQALFVQEGDIYHPTAAAGSPWHPALLHGGSPAGLLSFLIEAQTPDGMRPARVSMDLLRPVPKQPLTARCYPLRAGGRLQVHIAELWHDGKLVARASGSFVKPVPIELPEYVPEGSRLRPLPDFIGNTTFGDAVLADKALDIPYGLHNVLEVRPLTPLLEQGQARAWMRVPVPVVAGMPLTPFTRVGVLSDFANAVGQLNLGNDTGMINADITLQLHRLPTSEWIGLDGAVRVGNDGIGCVTCTLFDAMGDIGCVVQTVMPQQEYRG